MELKQYDSDREEFRSLLLIVPYGIETVERFIEFLEANKLLIVPYGIETKRDMLPSVLK